MVVACIMENQDDKGSRDCQYFLHRGQLQNQEIEIDMIIKCTIITKLPFCVVGTTLVQQQMIKITICM